MVEKYAMKSTMGESPVQKDYQRVMTQAMGPLGAQWHGEIRSQMSADFLHRNAPWFLA
jgi:hypothetical protein